MWQIEARAVKRPYIILKEYYLFPKSLNNNGLESCGSEGLDTFRMNTGLVKWVTKGRGGKGNKKNVDAHHMNDNRWREAGHQQKRGERKKASKNKTTDVRFEY